MILALLAATCMVTDGDTIRCGDERIRITGIDAPETGRCPSNRQCVPGDGQASKRSLELFIANKRISIIRLGEDRYKRTLGVVYADGVNVACHQLSNGQAQYVERWDQRGYVRNECF